MAEIALSRPRPDPERALEYLERIGVDPPSLSSWILVDRGSAHYLLARFDQAENCWTNALRRDPMIMEAGRRLLDLYGLQGRLEEARELAFRQFEREPSAHERLKLLLRLVRLDVDPPDPWIIVDTFQPALEGRHVDSRTTVAVGLALVTISRSQEGLPLLRGVVEREPDSPQAWDALLSGLELASEDKELSDVFVHLPSSLRDDVRFARHRGWLEQAAGRWVEAAEHYRRSWEYKADNSVGYRLRRTLRLAGLTEQAAQFDRVVLDYRDAFKSVRGAIDEANAALKDGKPIRPELYPLIAELRQRMGRADEARAWHRLAPLASARTIR
jgi:tetratricopeptide (TPR) repeat protein